MPEAAKTDAPAEKPKLELVDGQDDRMAIDDLMDTDKWPKVLKLRKKVQAHGQEVDQLQFREPTGGDIERTGVPVNHTQYGPMPDSANMGAMMALLANVPPSTIKQLNAKDWSNGAWLLVRFLTPDL